MCTCVRFQVTYFMENVLAKHVGAALHQLVEYRQLDIKVAPDDKTCTDILQKWHVPGEGQNQEQTRSIDFTVRGTIVGTLFK